MADGCRFTRKTASKGHPALQFIRDVPTDWEETRVLNAKAGDFITVVRKDLASVTTANTWGAQPMKTQSHCP